MENKLLEKCPYQYQAVTSKFLAKQIRSETTEL